MTVVMTIAARASWKSMDGTTGVNSGIKCDQSQREYPTLSAVVGRRQLEDSRSL